MTTENMTTKQIAVTVQEALGPTFNVVDRLDSEKQAQLRVKDKDGKYYIIAILAEAM